MDTPAPATANLMGSCSRILRASVHMRVPAKSAATVPPARPGKRRRSAVFAGAVAVTIRYSVTCYNRGADDPGRLRDRAVDGAPARGGRLLPGARVSAGGGAGGRWSV